MPIQIQNLFPYSQSQDKNPLERNKPQTLSPKISYNSK